MERSEKQNRMCLIKSLILFCSDLLRQHIILMCLSMLQSMGKMFKSPESQDLYQRHLSEFVSCVQDRQLYTDSEGRIQALTHLLSQLVLPDLFIVTECLNGILALSGEACDIKTLGRVWVYVGLLGMMLHRPRSPVDPVVKTQILLQLKEREVRTV